ncbi:hypothetical protein F7731_10755 [Cytobacillus depressus]|uniref:Uncharacterized protein n=1 Tax=Cytobacillus depressus TaxID=1602942 RepID=A0A6L3V893_9BACI|nr:hypothetical protein [Cytobacillus depressus]KAB2336817.1 hypothetical protein F7731_10755 [Cytobacillus depressus]
MKRKIWIYGFILISVIILISYGIDTKNNKLLTIKTAEQLSVINLYEQMEFTNKILSSNDSKLLAKVHSVDSNNQYFTYLSHSFDQYYINMVSLGLVESQNFREVEDVWRTYLRNIVDISEINIKEAENLEKRLLEIKNNINNEEANLRKKIDNTWWR